MIMDQMNENSKVSYHSAKTIRLFVYESVPYSAAIIRINLASLFVNYFCIP